MSLTIEQGEFLALLGTSGRPGFFRVLAHLPQGLASHQDIVLLQRE